MFLFASGVISIRNSIFYNRKDPGVRYWSPSAKRAQTGKKAAADRTEIPRKPAKTPVQAGAGGKRAKPPVPSGTGGKPAHRPQPKTVKKAWNPRRNSTRPTVPNGGTRTARSDRSQQETGLEGQLMDSLTNELDWLDDPIYDSPPDRE